MMSSQKHKQHEPEDEVLLSQAEGYYAALSFYLRTKGKKILGVYPPDAMSYTGFCMWVAQLNAEELQRLKALFYDRWNFVSNSGVDRALFIIFDKWEVFRRGQENKVRPQSK